MFVKLEALYTIDWKDGQSERIGNIDFITTLPLMDLLLFTQCYGYNCYIHGRILEESQDL
jgi:hypothetical protein